MLAVSVGSCASVLQTVRCSNCRRLRNDFLLYGFGSGMRRGQGREIIQSHDLPLASSVWTIFFPSYGNKKLVQKVRKTGIVSLKHVARFEQTLRNFPLCLRRTLFVSCGSVRVSCQLGSCWHHKLVCRRSGLTTHPRDIWPTFGFQRATTFSLCCGLKLWISEIVQHCKIVALPSSQPHQEKRYGHNKRKNTSCQRSTRGACKSGSTENLI